MHLKEKANTLHHLKLGKLKFGIRKIGSHSAHRTDYVAHQIQQPISNPTNPDLHEFFDQLKQVVQTIVFFSVKNNLIS